MVAYSSSVVAQVSVKPSHLKLVLFEAEVVTLAANLKSVSAHPD